jgi:FkbM family methyltransferase
MSLVQRLMSLGRRTLGYRSHNDLDRKLKHWLTGRGGVFIEAGANDGVSQSNTYYYEKRRGWGGLLVEPIPELAARCRQNRPRAKVVNCALGTFEQEGTTVQMTYCNLMSLVSGAMDEEAAKRHVQAGVNVQSLPKTYEIEVPCRALGNILDELSMPHVDLLSLDVEGYELNVLRGLDLPRQAPAYILIEARFEQPLRDHLEPYYNEVARLSGKDILFAVR